MTHNCEITYTVNEDGRFTIDLLVNGEMLETLNAPRMENVALVFEVEDDVVRPTFVHLHPTMRAEIEDQLD